MPRSLVAQFAEEGLSAQEPSSLVRQEGLSAQEPNSSVRGGGS